eukprot:Sspe_Gene.13055::Locus_4478_Transcript_1_1_Confidence_1.000_Length_1182::g.13055::m.13055
MVGFDLAKLKNELSELEAASTSKGAGVDAQRPAEEEEFRTLRLKAVSDADDVWPQPLDRLKLWEEDLQEREARAARLYDECQDRIKALENKHKWIRSTKARLEEELESRGLPKSLLASVAIPVPPPVHEDTFTGDVAVWKLPTDSAEMFERKSLHRNLDIRERDVARKVRRMNALAYEEMAAGQHEHKLTILQEDLNVATALKTQLDHELKRLALREKEASSAYDLLQRRRGEVAKDTAVLRALERQIHRESHGLPKEQGDERTHLPSALKMDGTRIEALPDTPVARRKTLLTVQDLQQDYREQTEAARKRLEMCQQQIESLKQELVVLDGKERDLGHQRHILADCELRLLTHPRKAPAGL